MDTIWLVLSILGGVASDRWAGHAIDTPVQRNGDVCFKKVQGKYGDSRCAKLDSWIPQSFPGAAMHVWDRSGGTFRHAKLDPSDWLRSVMPDTSGHGDVVQNGKFGTFLKFNIKVLGGEWLYCQINWDDNGQAIVTYLMEEAFGRHLVSKSKSADNFCKLLSTTPLNGTFEVTLKRRTLSENEGRQYTNWYVWINREDSPLEDARRQRWIDSDTERNGSNEERGDDNGPANTISPTPFEDATE